MVVQVIDEKFALDFSRDLSLGWLHDKRCRSIAYGALGVMFADDLSVSGVGRGMARARGTSPKHSIKQVDRLLSNDGVEMDVWFSGWVTWVVGKRSSVVVALDWTEHAHDEQTTIAAYLVTRHGRATPLLWKTVDKDKLKNNRNRHEDELLAQLKEKMPSETEVTILADRGFGDTKLYDYLEELDFKYVIRFRSDIHVRTKDARQAPASEFLLESGKAKRYNDVELTETRRKTAGLVTVHARKMKDAWYLATNCDASATAIVKLYGRRFSIEETFRDEKDPHFGLGLSQTHIGTSGRRDRLLMLAAIAHALLTLVGRAGETLGLDRQLRANTQKKRTHSLFRQGREYIRGIFERFSRELRRAFRRILRGHNSNTNTYGWI